MAASSPATHPWMVEIPPIESDLAAVAELVNAARNTPAPATFDIKLLRANNAERVNGPYRRSVVEGTEIAPAEFESVAGEWLRVPGGSDRITILYVHGGAYVRGSLRQARPIASTLAAITGGRTFSVDYRQAPEHPFPAPLEDGAAVYRGLLKQGVDPKSVVFAGDSCGGSIIVATMLVLRDRGLPLPAAAISISPFADLTVSGESRRTHALTDSTAPNFSEFAARMYLGGGDPRAPLASPINADLHGLPPLLIIVGGDEALYSDSVALSAAARRGGVDVTQQTYLGMIHVFPLLALKTGDLALRNMAEFVARHIGGRGEKQV